MNTRKRKEHILTLLASDSWEDHLEELAGLGQKAISPLFSALYNTSSLVRWHAVTAFGVVVGTLAAQAPEKARVIMRRFIWNLNDESGGIGWGSPEAMAEVVAQSPLMAKEYHNHVLAYIHEDHCRPDCYLEHAPLRRGAVWGVGRLAQVKPELARPAEMDLLCLLTDCDTPIRGLAAWACGLLQIQAARPMLQTMLADQNIVELYLDRRLTYPTLGSLAQEALARTDRA